MSDTVTLYTVVDSRETAKANRQKVERVDKLLVVQATYDRAQAKPIFDAAEPYMLHLDRHSYYEGYYDRWSEETRKLEKEEYLVKDGQLFGFIFACERSETGCATRKFKGVLRLTDVGTDASVMLYSDSSDHGDTMSESSTEARLIRKNG